MTGYLRFSQKSPCDYMMFYGEAGLFFTLELKTFLDSCSFERMETDNGIIHSYQIESLKKFHTYPNVISGFILDFRKSDTTYFLSIVDFCNMIKGITKKSFTEKDMLNYCKPIKIEKKKLRVNYRYNIEKFLQEVKEQQQIAKPAIST